jgi:hypothetical protein
MSDDMSVFVNEDSGFYIESLIKSLCHLKKGDSLAVKLRTVIEEELDLALMAAQKAKSEILKKNAKEVSPLKPV